MPRSARKHSAVSVALAEKKRGAMLNLFSLHGKYYENNENRLTANFLFLLSEFRSTFLSAFLQSIGIDDFNPSEVEIVMQPSIELENRWKVPDAFIRCGEKFHVVIEAKIGRNGLDMAQLREYATDLGRRNVQVKRLVAITQMNDSVAFANACSASASVLPENSWFHTRWFRILQLLRESAALTSEYERSIERSVSRGKEVDYQQRLLSMFLQEVEATMYERIVVNDVRAGDLVDVRLTTQKKWFMDVALRHRVWFPDGTLTHGFEPSRWVAFYETADSPANPKRISYIARNQIFWNRITLEDAMQVPELRHVFADAAVRKEIQTWPMNEQKTFHIVLTDAPVRLERPIPLGRTQVAKVITKRKCSLETFLNAESVDAFFKTAKA